MDWEYFAKCFSEPGRFLYHYTDARGLEGIINNEEIWATDHGYLNDNSEFDYGIKIFKEVVGSAEFRDFNLFKSRFDYKSDFVYAVKTLSRKDGVYCCSFTSEGDLLSQWRGYCPKDGYSIKFSTDYLKQLSDVENFKFFRCVYEKSEQRSIAQKIINDFLCFVEDTEINAPLSKDQFQAYLRSTVKFFASAFKDDHYRQEHEWRLVFLPPWKGVVCHRAKGNVVNVIPYVTQALPSQTIEEIIVGPCGNRQLAKKYLKILLKSKGLDPKITYSEIPFRAV